MALLKKLAARFVRHCWPFGPRVRGALVWAALWCIGVTCGWGQWSNAAAPPSGEAVAETPAAGAGSETPLAPQRAYRVKAAFLVNFVRFTEWPADALGPPGAPIVIGVLGLNPFGDDLVNAVRDRTLHDRPVRVINIATREEFESCHVIFVTADDHLRWDPLLLALRDRPVLTVGEEPHFARDLGLVGFFLEGERVRFEVNLQATERAGLRMSSRMLTLARIVGRRPSLR
jgi:hypothetical protein